MSCSLPGSSRGCVGPTQRSSRLQPRKLGAPMLPLIWRLVPCMGSTNFMPVSIPFLSFLCTSSRRRIGTGTSHFCMASLRPNRSKPESSPSRESSGDPKRSRVRKCSNCLTPVHTRDRLLLALLFSTGLRIGQILGLKHEDVSVEDGTIHIVPRDDNPNGARAKTRTSHVIPVEEEILRLYTDYLVDELCALEVSALPDFVFVNLFEGEVGRPMTYAAVMSLVKRLAKRTGVRFIMRDKLRKVKPPANNQGDVKVPKEEEMGVSNVPQQMRCFDAYPLQAVRLLLGSLLTFT